MVLNKSGFFDSDDDDDNNNGSNFVTSWHWPESLTHQNRKIEKLRLTRSIFSSYKSALQKVAHVVHFKSDLSSLSYTVDRVTTCGSMGKWTAVRDMADVDLIVYIDNSGGGLSPDDLPLMIPECINQIERAIDKQYPQAKPTKTKTHVGGLSYTINGLHIDIHVGMTNVLPKDFLLISDRKVRQFLSTSVSHLNKRLIQGQSHLYHDMVRVVKDWRDTFQWDVGCKPKSYMLEVLMLEVFKDLRFCSKNTLKTGPQFPHYCARWARQKILYNFFDMIGRVEAYHPQMDYDKDNLPSLFVCSSPHFTIDDLPLDEPQPIFESVRIVSVPTESGGNKNRSNRKGRRGRRDKNNNTKRDDDDDDDDTARTATTTTMKKVRKVATAIVIDPVNPTNNLWLTLGNATTFVHRAQQTAIQLSSIVPVNDDDNDYDSSDISVAS